MNFYPVCHSKTVPHIGQHLHHGRTSEQGGIVRDRVVQDEPALRQVLGRAEHLQGLLSLAPLTMRG